ncbi:MAG TPA: DHA2 family efflux MFS transporter permease subunit [Xanthobacteraceae bacterium]|nr:DHA2 family efflux MFS transporter permease subunit [Xanthobacteraceae bacterium]
MTEPAQFSGRESRSAAGDRSPWLIAIVVSIATFMVVLDTAIANVALRHIAGSLAVSVDESTWVVTTYLVANAVVLPVSGWLSNVIGRKRFYMICVAVFTIASLLCGLATSLTALIVFRILQGIGGGGMPTSEQAMLADTFPPRQRPQAFAIYGVAVIVAPTVGPTIGGWITDNYSWHWIFFINVPFGILSLILVQWLVVEPDVLERERRERLAGGLKIDWVGLTLVALIFGSLEIVLDRGQIDDWFSSTTIVTFATISACSLIFFIPWELTRDDPIVDLRLLFQRQFGMAFIAMLAVGAVLFGSNQITPQLMQTNFPYTAMLSGLAMMPGGLAMLLMMPLAGQIIPRLQPKYWLAIGFSLVALAMWYSTSLVPDASFGYFAMMRVYQTVGMPFLFIPINSVAYSGLPAQKTNEASALVNVARNLGGSIGVSLANTELVQRSQFHQARLVENAVPSSPVFQSTMHHLTQYFSQFSSSAAGAQARAIGYVGQTIADQAALMGYIDIFYTWAVVAALLVPAVLLLIRRVAPDQARAGIGH